MPIDDAVHLAQLLQTGKYSDMMLVCAGKEFKLHRMIVCSQSSVIAAALDGLFKESQTGVIEIEGFSAETVGDMVEFLYTGNYGDPYLPEGLLLPCIMLSARERSSILVETTAAGDQQSSTSGDEADTSSSMLVQRLLRHVRTNAIADYYNIPKLAELTRSKIKQAQLDEWDPNVWLDVTKTALTITGDSDFHDTLAQIFAGHASEFLDKEQGGEIIGDFGMGVLRHRIRAAKMDDYRLRLEILELREELRAEQVRREVLEARLHRVIENMRNCVQTLGERDMCRNGTCHADFDCYIEQRGQTHEPMFTLRCAKCRCKH